MLRPSLPRPWAFDSQLIPLANRPQTLMSALPFAARPPPLGNYLSLRSFRLLSAFPRSPFVPTSSSVLLLSSSFLCLYLAFSLDTSATHLCCFMLPAPCAALLTRFATAGWLIMETLVLRVLYCADRWERNFRGGVPCSATEMDKNGWLEPGGCGFCPAFCSALLASR